MGSYTSKGVGGGFSGDILKPFAKVIIMKALYF